jgi:hypothetical protein
MQRFYVWWMCLLPGLFYAINVNAQVLNINNVPFQPKEYVCYRTDSGIEVDGHLNDADWQKVPWSDDFVDIEGDKRPAPAHRTRVKMLWDERYLYFAVEMEEPHVWATITEHDAVIFHDNDFEIFIDPNGDTHHYLEYEVNALGTTWDLMLTKPYRDGGSVINSWEIAGLKQGIVIDGTLNDPSDTDKYWTLEVAIPLRVIAEAGKRRFNPDGDWLRVNFSRVQWLTRIENGAYIKLTNEKGKLLPEQNWVWSPQGVIDMHRPETWGFVRLSPLKAGAGIDTAKLSPDEKVKWALRQVYYRQRDFHHQHGRYASLKELNMKQISVDGVLLTPQLFVFGRSFAAALPSTSGKGTIWIRNDGLTWFEN